MQVLVDREATAGLKNAFHGHVLAVLPQIFDGSPLVGLQFLDEDLEVKGGLEGPFSLYFAEFALVFSAPLECRVNFFVFQVFQDAVGLLKKGFLNQCEVLDSWRRYL